MFAADRISAKSMQMEEQLEYVVYVRSSVFSRLD